MVALLQAGELDYIWSYESIAQATGLRYVTLPTQIDLSNLADSAMYAVAAVRIAGRTPTDTITLRGAPIVYGLSIPKNAPHPQLAEKFVAWLLSTDGRRILRGARLDALEVPVLIGEGVPHSVTEAVNAPPLP